MIVCLCTGVNDKQIRNLVASGHSSVKAIAKQCGAGAECGSCVRDIRRLLPNERCSASSFVLPAHAVHV